MPHQPSTRTFYSTVPLAVLALILSTLAAFTAAPAQAAGPTSTQITAAVGSKAAPPDGAAPYFSVKLDINYSGSGPITLSSSADGTKPFMFRDSMLINAVGATAPDGGTYHYTTMSQDCKTDLGPVTPKDVKFYFKPGINHVTVTIYNWCGHQQVDALYLTYDAGFTPPPPVVVPPEVLCGTANFIGVRGSGEHAGYGPTMDALDSALRRNVPGIHAQFVSYWAIDVDVRPWHITYPADYVNSVQNGVDALKAVINNYWKICPNKYVVLGGYSQGAEVVRKAFAELKKEQQLYVAAVVLFGDPLFNPKDSSVNKGNYTPGFRGIDIALYGDKATKVPARLSQRLQDYCTYGDPVCNWNALFTAACLGAPITINATCPHLRYVQRGWVDDSISGVVTQLKIRHVL